MAQGLEAQDVVIQALGAVTQLARKFIGFLPSSAHLCFANTCNQKARSISKPQPRKKKHPIGKKIIMYGKKNKK